MLPPTPAVTFVNPLDVDGFAEPRGHGCVAVAALPLLFFLPGMDGSLTTPFMQYPSLGASFELRCMQHSGELGSRCTFEDLTAACADEVAAATSGGRRAVMVGESFGATLAIAVAHRLQQQQQQQQQQHGLVGLCLVNPATSYARSRLARFGPLCASLTGPLYPLYPLSLVLFAALVLSPMQAPAFASMLLSAKSPALLASPHREAWLGRVALSAFLGQRGPGLAIGKLLAVQIFAPEDLAFRLEHWLDHGAALVDEAGLASELRLPAMCVVGENDRLLPSLDEAARLAQQFGSRWRGTVAVPGAGHASTLGVRVDLCAVLREGFGAELALRPQEQMPQMPRGDKSSGLWRGMLDRAFPPLDPTTYTQWNRGGELWPGRARAR